MVTYEQLRKNDEVSTYIKMADNTMLEMGYTEHSFAHVTKVASQSGQMLYQLGYDERTCELAKLAGYLHDIGNVINRADHAQSGAMMAYNILNRLGMDPKEIASIITAIGNHDEETAIPVNPIAAALILADKSDVRRSRVRKSDIKSMADIHTRVNYSVVESGLKLDVENAFITLELTIDTEKCAVMDYFEIFMKRMLLCKKAAEYLSLTFRLRINGSVLL